MPLNVGSPPPPPLGSARSPLRAAGETGLICGELVDAPASWTASFSTDASPVALYSSVSPLRITPWLYVQTAPPLLAHVPPELIVSPSLIRFCPLIIPLCRNQLSSAMARAR